MTKRGRQSAEDVQTEAAIAHLKASTQPIEPPDHLEGDVRRVFCETVASVSRSHFTDGDIPMLETFAKATLCTRKLEDFADWEKAARLQASLATRLRLTPQSRYDTRAAGRKANELPSDRRRPWEE